MCGRLRSYLPGCPSWISRTGWVWGGWFLYWFFRLTLAWRHLCYSRPSHQERLHRFNPFPQVQSRRFRQTSSYRDYQREIQEMSRNPSSYPHPPEYFLTTSGTTGQKKRLPFFRYFPLPNTVVLPFLRPEVWGPMTSGKTLFMFHVGNQWTVKGIPVSNGVTRQFHRILDSSWGRWFFESHSVSPLSAFNLAYSYRTRMDLHLLYALSEPNLQVIFGYFNRSILQEMEYLIQHWSQFALALNQGFYETVHEDQPELVYFSAQKERAREFSQLMRTGSPRHRGLMTHLWPSLQLIIGAHEGSFEMYQLRLQQLAPMVPIFSPYYATTEMIIGLNLGPLEESHFTLDPGFGAVETQMTHPLISGEELLLTNNHGLYRYRSGDLVRQEGMQIDYVARSPDLINLAEVTLVPKEVITALHRVMGASLIDYLFEVSSPQDWTLYLETKEGVQIQNPPELARRIDTELQSLSRYYQQARSHGLPLMQIQPLHPRTFQELFSLRGLQHGNPPQMKPIRRYSTDWDPELSQVIERNRILKN